MPFIDIRYINLYGVSLWCLCTLRTVAANNEVWTELLFEIVITLFLASAADISFGRLSCAVYMKFLDRK